MKLPLRVTTGRNCPVSCTFERRLGLSSRVVLVQAVTHGADYYSNQIDSDNTYYIHDAHKVSLHPTFAVIEYSR